jgi:hypothetical protein
MTSLWNFGNPLDDSKGIQKYRRERVNWIKIKAGLNILSPILLVFLLLVLDVQFSSKINFYIGLGIFLPVYVITYFWDIRYFKLIRAIDFSMPFAMIGFLLMIIQKITFSYNLVSVIPLLLIILVFFSSMYFTFKYSIN